MKNLFERYEGNERLTREENIALRLIQEASVYLDVNTSKSITEEIERIENLATEAFAEKNIKLGSSLKRATTLLEKADIRLKNKIEETEETKPLVEILNKYKSLPREESSREISLAITAIEEAILWLSK